MVLLASDGALAWMICHLDLAMVSINKLSVDSWWFLLFLQVFSSWSSESRRNGPASGVTRLFFLASRLHPGASSMAPSWWLSGWMWKSSPAATAAVSIFYCFAEMFRLLFLLPIFWLMFLLWFRFTSVPDRFFLWLLCFSEHVYFHRWMSGITSGFSSIQHAVDPDREERVGGVSVELGSH